MADESVCRVFRSRNEAHEGTVAPSSRSAKKMQPWYRGFQRRTENRKTIDTLELPKNARSQEGIAGNVNTIAGAQKYVVGRSDVLLTIGHLRDELKGDAGGSELCVEIF